MIDFESSDALELEEGDTLEVVTAIRKNDIVVFERTGPSAFIIRTLEDQEIDVYEGCKYRVDIGREPGTIKLTFT